MDFFARQDQARHKTSVLLFYFAASIFLILLSLNVVAIEIVDFATSGPVASVAHRGQPAGLPHWAARTGFWQPDIIVCVTTITLFIIGMGSLYKVIRLSGGGPSVAEMMRAVEIPPSPSDPKQRMLRNVVEEMSIASGVPVPRIYLLPRENGINGQVSATQGHLSASILRSVCSREKLFRGKDC